MAQNHSTGPTRPTKFKGSLRSPNPNKQKQLEDEAHDKVAKKYQELAEAKAAGKPTEQLEAELDRALEEHRVATGRPRKLG